MTDSIQLLPPGWRAFDANGAIISGAKIKAFENDEVTPRNLYSDEALTVSLGSEVECDSGGYPTSDGNAKVTVWSGTGTFKVQITDDNDAEVVQLLQVKGALDTTSFGTGSGVFKTPVEASASSETITSADAGKFFKKDPTGGDITLTLPDATTLDNGFRIGAGHYGSANSVRFLAVSNQTIQVPGARNTTKGYVFAEEGHSGWLVADEGNWTLDIETLPIAAGLVIADRLTAPPTSPSAGARYIINGTPTGDWASFSEHDIVEADGQGTWIQYKPRSGMLAYVVDEDLFTRYDGTDWDDQSGMAAPNSSNLQVLEVQHQETSGTDGGGTTAETWAKRDLTEVTNTDTGASVNTSTDQITLPAGTYLVLLSGSTNLGSGAYSRLYSSAASKEVRTTGVYANSSSAHGLATVGMGPLVLASEATDLELQTITKNTAASNGLGRAANITSLAEIFGSCTIINLSALQGPPGAQGDQGNTGPGYQATSTTSLAIGTGSKAFTTQSGLAYSAGARVRASSQADSANYMEGVVASYSGTTLTLTVDATGGSGTLADWNINLAGEAGVAGSAGAAATVAAGTTTTGAAGTNASVANSGTSSAAVFDFTIPRGNTGATGPNTGLDFAFATSTSGNPGTGKAAVNNASWASATTLRINKTGRNGESLGTTIGNFGDSSSSVKGHIRVFTVADRTEYLEADITAVTDQTDYYDLTLTDVEASGTEPDADDVICIVFARTGDAGSGAVTSVNGESGAVTLTADEIDLASSSPSNYSAADAKVETHIEGIDTALGNKTGSDTDYVTGTAGTNGNLVQWNGDGDAVDSSIASANVITTTDTASTSAAGISEFATSAEYRDNTSGKVLTTDQVYSAMAEVSLTDAASISWDMDTGFDFTVTLGGNRTLANPTNVEVGKKGRIRVVQDGTGSRTLSYGSNFEFAGGTAPTLTTTANAEDILYYDCISATRILITSVLDIS